MQVLVIEDDAQTAEYLVEGLNRRGHTALATADGREGLILALSNPFDVMVIDRMLPAMDGLSILKSIRQAGVDVPVLFLTALSGVEDRVEGLSAGGDDYLVKPFVFSELLARLEALVRRPSLTQPTTKLRVADLEINLLTRQVRRGGRPISLLPKEFQVLEYLARNADRVVTRTMLLERIWGFHFDPKTKIVETQISRIRAKINGDGDRQILETVRGSGYIIRATSA